jgi:uncharacterized protein YndB with AHSA1/START domain
LIVTEIHPIPSDADRLIVHAHFANLSPEQVFDAFTRPDLLTRWWSPQAEVDARVGGAYHLIWAQQNWHLRGSYVEFARGKRLVFTWHWDHEPEVPARMVEIEIAPDGSSTSIILTHGFYAAGDNDERQGHLDGWTYFLEQLGNLAA